MARLFHKHLVHFFVFCFYAHFFLDSFFHLLQPTVTPEGDQDSAAALDEVVIDNPFDMWCGTSQSDANKNRGSGIPCPDTTCPTGSGLDCFMVINPANLWCGKSQSDAEKNAGSGIPCPNTFCPIHLECFSVADPCDSEDGTHATTVEPTRSPIISSPGKDTNPNNSPVKSPIAMSPSPTTLEPISRPSEKPTKSPIQKPTTLEPVASPSEKPVMSPTQTHVTIDNNSNTVSSNLKTPQLLCAISMDELDASCATAQPCHDGPCPSGQFCFPYDCEEPIIEKPILEKETNVKDEQKFYCAPPTMNNFDNICGSVVECNAGNRCPSGQFCTQYNCKQTESKAEFCPSRYDGRYFSKDCKTYYDCDNGSIVGPSSTCDEGFKYDRVRNECFDENLVNSFCFGPALEVEKKQYGLENLKDDIDDTPDMIDNGNLSSSSPIAPSQVVDPIPHPTPSTLPKELDHIPDVEREANDSVIVSKTNSPTMHIDEPEWADWSSYMRMDISHGGERIFGSSGTSYAWFLIFCVLINIWSVYFAI